ncbi:hypothetical protein ACFO3N_04700, partial [Flavobacterium chungangensis]
MKNRLLPLAFILGGFGAFAQVGVGTQSPNRSAQLEVFATDKGILIPRVALTSTTDTKTITNGNVDSLLVFNTATATDIKPGYYYWFNNKWNRILISGDVNNNTGNVIYDPVSNEFTYIDNSGNVKIINIANLIKLNETLTTLENKGGGLYTYTNEAGDTVDIEVVGDVIKNFSTITNNKDVKKILEQLIKVTGGNVTYNSSTEKFYYKDANGKDQEIDIPKLIHDNETLTTIENKGGGLYRYTNEAGDTVDIEVVGDVIKNFSTIANNTDVKKILEQLIKVTGGNVTYNSSTEKFYYKDANGNDQEIDLPKLVQDNETVTKLEGKGKGLYRYTNEAGDTVDIEVVGDVTSNFTTIVADPDVKRILEELIKVTGGNVSYNSSTEKFYYKDANGNDQEIDLPKLVKDNETLTTLEGKGKGVYRYTNEAG